LDGVNFRIKAEPDGTDPAAYYARQKRFTGQEINLERVKTATRRKMRRLRQLASMNQ